MFTNWRQTYKFNDLFRTVREEMKRRQKIRTEESLMRMKCHGHKGKGEKTGQNKYLIWRPNAICLYISPARHF